MKVIRAKILGFCMGVRSAVEMAENLVSKNNSKRKTFMLGPLIHNPLVVDSFKNRGMEVIDISSAYKIEKDSSVLIQAHGTTSDIIDMLKKKEVEVFNATCPKVMLNQRRVLEWSEKGFFVIITGDKNHSEVISVSSYVKGDFIVVENVDDVKKIEIPEKSILISQTTFSPIEFEKIANFLKSKVPGIKIFNSICSATQDRQKSLKELEGKTDGIIVIGGKNSANVRRLFETASMICKNVALVENVADVPLEFLSMETVGITAGASTPDFIIDEVEKFLMNS